MEEEYIIHLKQGSLRGFKEEFSIAFKGIPYAAPAVGPNRFKEPQPPLPWSGVRDASKIGPTSPHAELPALSWLGDLHIPGDEYLNLNIWRPQDMSKKELPVFVWIHGGGFTMGSGAWNAFNGSRFARDGVVCVTINYRLGIDGFMLLENVVPNLGIRDQLFALEWVKENICHFGGNPHDVTLCGESAGGMSVVTLMTIPRAKGLFRRAIAQSGAGHQCVSRTFAEKIAKLFSEKFSVQLTSEAIEKIPYPELFNYQNQLSDLVLSSNDPELISLLSRKFVTLAPVVDGDLIPDHPYNALLPDVDLLVGSNLEEWKLMLIPAGLYDRVTEEMLVTTCTQLGLPVESTLATYRAALPNANPADILVAIGTDFVYRIPAILLAEQNIKKNSHNQIKTYMYIFDGKSSIFGGQFGSGHGVDLPFVFDTVDFEESQSLIGKDVSPANLILSKKMHKAWVDFVKNGNPGWDVYNLENRSTMILRENFHLENDPWKSVREFWIGKRDT
jgi:para-nitrobenzyl esterase